MAIYTVCLHADGSISDFQHKPLTLEELGKKESEGIYTITRTFRGDHAVLLDAHLDRLVQSAHLEEIPLQLSREDVRSAVRALLRRAQFPDARIRISIAKDNPECVGIACERMVEVPLELREKGVLVGTHLITRPNPQAKSNIWENLRAQARKELPENVYEGIVRAEDGTLLEGFSSNFYAIKGGVFRTSDREILEGVARRIVLLVAEGLLPIETKAINIDEVSELDEAFLSSSGRGVVPIIGIDGYSVGDGSPGPLTHEIDVRYRSWVETHLEPI